MKAISIKEPWASMIANGEKTIETRTWATNHCGPLLICVSKKPKSELSGMAIAIVYVKGCWPLSIDDPVAWEHAHCTPYCNAYGWYFNSVYKIKPFPVKGKLGLFEVEYN